MTATGSPSPTWEDADLVAACRRGDQQAWAALIDKYKNLVYSISFKYRLSPEDAADVFQAAWADLYQELRQDRDVRSVRAWIATVAAHKSYQTKMKAQSRPSVSLTELEHRVADTGSSGRELIQEAQKEQLLREAVAELPDRCRRIVDLLFFADPPVAYRDLAKLLGLAEGSIGFIRGRCLKRLAKTLGESGF